VITLKLNAYFDDEVKALIERLNVINPAHKEACYLTSCDRCEVRHICYDIDKALEYCKGALEGRDKKCEK
jgi:hypothetical protein